MAARNSPSRTASSLASVGLRSSKSPSEMIPNDDLRFLVYFIMGTYFGPDLKEEKHQKSVFQRKAEGLPPYTSDQLAGSHLKIVDVERVYYYVLRKADQSLKLNISLLQQFFQGKLPTLGRDINTVAYPQFPDLFPPELHPHSWFESRHNIIENIVFINNPEVSHMKPEDIERFKRLSGLNNFRLDSEAARLHASVDIGDLYDVEVQVIESTEEFASLTSSRDIEAHMTPLPAKDDTSPAEKVGPAMIFLPSHPTKQEWDNILAATKSGFALTGSAAMGQVGPVVGRMDIGECEDSYLFRVSLPGVKRNERDFSCEVESSGKVSIRGVTTTGEKRVYKYSQVFEMQTQNLCPPGRFSVSFQLPGPVDPQQFSGNFGADGIFEGIVMKRKT